MKSSKTNIWVGLFMCLGLLAVLFLALQSANLLSLRFEKTYPILAQFDNVGSLKPRAAVKSAGVVVGRVRSITLDDKTYRAVVTLDMEQRFAFPQDSSLKILTSGLLGEQYVGIEAGSDDKTLQAGETLHVTQSAVVLENLISQFLYSKAAAPADNSASASTATSSAKSASTMSSMTSSGRVMP
jgi:phospholipid/cholesterol/gamma-HCH transport system substrate-binding protein